MSGIHTIIIIHFVKEFNAWLNYKSLVRVWELSKVRNDNSYEKNTEKHASKFQLDYTKCNKNVHEFISSIQNYDALIVRSDTKITADILESGAKNLKAVGRAGVGVDNIDVDAATKHNIIVLK